MASDIDTLRDGTVAFLPHRLNRQPVIVRGLTADELWITVGLSALAGIVLGVPLAWLTRSIAMAPTTIMASISTGIFAGGTLLRRQKRGRPDTWLYRQWQWWLHCHIPLISRWIGARALIVRSGAWTVRRTTSPTHAGGVQ
ncbi:conjugative transfer region protein [Burkholderia pseudomallei]|uniref:TIGR03750 family conjugal transfer protein n=1 Tax=Burkholderia pseudomallei TaxID=28450 RepID=UPI000F047FAD|nr:TIGR03750 family conjugal transfer protein [Burkholderia pseudomallei]CAJ2752196.1 conjugative transfer region protein [Burkholderia pseudomallei]VCJ93124.1 conjugative transfer region protein [Burkholderia pseudomallei]VCJ95100.1 conjugative transfer region protein [Burkholderia pseudomallei]VCJ95598.1 conjugative transfer region protein [Burkholderia pseudomallei]VCJ97671.1 conjugative transfer region protein [Burkholderia pseudomallei]